MRRVIPWAILTVLLLAGAGGCGSKSYESRLDQTLKEMRYRKRLDDNLNPAPRGDLETNLIFVRGPKGLSLEPAKEFQLTVLEPGKFDVAKSFFEQDKQNLHILARIKRPKGAANKKGAPAPAEVVRGDFTSDVLQVLSNAYNLDIDVSKAKEEEKKNNKFKHLTFEAEGKNVQVYINGGKGATYEVALIFAYPKAEHKALYGKIELCLESFATGDKARKFYSGAVSENETGDAATAAPVAF